MDIRNSILECVGNTPLVALDRFAPPGDGRGRVLGKLELLNPYSVKDRPALTMLREAQARGEIAPGRTTILEATSGNTGIALAAIARIKGYPITIMMPESVSIERRQMLQIFGADLVGQGDWTSFITWAAVGWSFSAWW